MANYNINDVHKHILRIAKTMHSVCQEHNLRYYIWAGTMIGAIRHKGFIPWDDDIDIAMPRADYNLLIKNAKQWLPQPFEFVCAENDDQYPLPFGKIQNASTTLIERMHLKYIGGIYLDVFPIDGAPEGWLKRKMHFAKYEYYKRVLYLIHRDPYKHGHGPSSWLPLLCRKIYNMKQIQEHIKTLLQKYDYDKCRLVADYDDGSKGTLLKSTLGTPTPYTFEDTMLNGVADYNTYLSNKYGNYMAIPPLEQQRQHNFHYLDLEHSYKDFQGK